MLAVVMIFSLAACTDGDADKQPTGSKENATETQTAKITVEEKVIYDDDGIVVTATGIDVSGLFGPELKVKVENNSSNNVTIQTRDCSINGLMVDTIFSCDVVAGKKANDSITFAQSELDISGITTIKDIEFTLLVLDSETYDEIDESDVIKLTTSADPSFVQQYDDSGFVALDKSGIKVIIKKLSDKNSFWGSEVFVYVENNTDDDITVQTDGVSINGYMVTPIFSCDVVEGKKAVDSIMFMESDLEDNGITDITEIELKLVIFESDSFDTIIKSDTVTVSFE